MTNVGESYQSKLARERAALLDEYIPAKRALQEKLRQQQDLKTQFSTGAEELFKPITTVTEKVVTAIEESKPVVIPPPPKKIYDEKVQEQRNKFKDELLAKIDEYNEKELAYFIADEFSNRNKYLQPGQNKSFIGSFDKWVDAVYRIKKGISEIDRVGDYNYEIFDRNAKFKDTANKLRATQIKQQKKEEEKRQKELRLEKRKRQSTLRGRGRGRGQGRRQIEPVMEEYSLPDQDVEEPPGKSGEGYHVGNLAIFDRLDACSKNILDDVSRLEVFVGGRRAGNNSPEVINEATCICQRLFQNGIIDTNIYRRLVTEIIDDYYSD